MTAIGAAAAAEPAITPAVKNAVEAHGATVVRLDFRFKPVQRLIRKIVEDREPADADAESAMRRINDVLRYTAVVPPDPDQWALGTLIGLSLVNAGYQQIQPRSGVRARGYKGRNERFVAPSGQRFELQIHTAETLQGCDDTRDIYEAMRDRNITREEEYELQKRRDDVFDAVPRPTGAPLI